MLIETTETREYLVKLKIFTSSLACLMLTRPLCNLDRMNPEGRGVMLGVRLLAICLLLSVTIDTAIAQQVQQQPQWNYGSAQAAAPGYMNGAPNVQAASPGYMNGAPNAQVGPPGYTNGAPNVQAAAPGYMNGLQSAPPASHMNWQQNSPAPYATTYLNSQAQPSSGAAMRNDQSAVQPANYWNKPLNTPASYGGAGSGQLAPQPSQYSAPGFNAPLLPSASGAASATAQPSFGIDGPLVERQVRAGNSSFSVQVPAVSGEVSTGGVDVDKRWPSVSI